MVLVDLLATALLAAVPFAIGAAVGHALPRLRRPLLALTGVPAAYFTANLLVALHRQGLDETLLVGIRLGNSPVFIMLLTAATAGPFLGLLAERLWRARSGDGTVGDG